ncbi:MAG: SDR family oxidoreductase [Anaerolineae bacterium]|nr:SDR family oxidoreductase [Anaerolineae bacterium]
MTRLLITGASGNLGKPLSTAAAERWETIGTYFTNDDTGVGERYQIDLRDRDDTLMMFEAVSPDVIIHTATSDRSEDLTRTIPEVTNNIVSAAEAVGCRLISLSTDVIFDGTRGPYHEDDPPTPTSPYSAAKAESDRIIINSDADALIVRTSLIYDVDPRNRQLGWMLNRIEKGEKLRLFTDELRQPIWVWNLVDVLLELVINPAAGILNAAGGTIHSRYEFGTALLHTVGIETEGNVEPVLAADISPLRPRNCTLDLTKAKALLRTPLLGLHEALPEAVKRYSKGHPTSTTTSR